MKERWKVSGGRWKKVIAVINSSKIIHRENDAHAHAHSHNASKECDVSR